MYTIVYEVGNQTMAPGAYPMNGQILIGFNRSELRTDYATELRHAGDLTFSKLNPSALRHLPMVKKDYPELFE